ncbi:Hemopexin [Merluccius polli]|uniref:Hemopexin n=1 Tax=Merluccius polli TaxID=89951 RepID=A0AA47PAF7_MERPO|nr:Hemopexin [Merluccius polli]
MKTMLSHCLWLALALALSHSAPPNLDKMTADEGQVAQVDRCEVVEFDAIAPDNQGVPHFFKGDVMWRGFHGPSELIKGSFKELMEQQGPINAVLSQDTEDADKHLFFLMVRPGDKVFNYHEQTLEEGWPKTVSEVFPGIPDHVDAAVECPKGECVRDSVIFFKGCEVHHYDTQTKKVKSSHWSHMPNCTAALRWQNHYYCFHGNQFTKFHPVTGTVTGTYPKDVRDYFMKCPNFGEWRCACATVDVTLKNLMDGVIHTFIRDSTRQQDGSVIVLTILQTFFK